MRYKISRFFAAALTVAGAVSAQAADLPSRTIVPVAPIMVAYDWTGFYIGAHAGAVFTDTNAGVDLNGYNMLGEVVGLGSQTSFIGGLTVGYNYQINQFVLGLEGDVSWLNYRATGTSAFFGGDTLYRAKADWFGTIRARAGVAFDRALIYVTGGVAFSDLKYSVNDACTLAPCGGATISASTSPDYGWTIGGGLEYALTHNWTAKAEYLYASFRGKTTTGTFAGAPFNFSFGSTDMHIVRAGVNYKF